jgi:hypothetical protein
MVNTHAPDTSRRTAMLVTFGIAVMVVSIVLEILAKWRFWEIVQSFGAAAALLWVALVRRRARDHESDPLWITALGHWLIDKLHALIKRLHAEQEEARPASTANTHDAAEQPAGSADVEVAAGSMLSRGREGASPILMERHPAAPADIVNAETERQRKIVERDGSWARAESDILWLKEESPQRPRNPERRPDG